METIGIVIFVVGIIIIGAILNRRDPEWQAKRLQGKMLFHLFEKRDWKDKEKVKKDMQKEFYEMDKVSSSKIEKLTNNDKKNSKHRQSMKNVLNSLPKMEVAPKVLIKKVISLEETIDNLTERIKSNLKMSFKDFSGVGKAEKVDIIVSFLAMLELVKLGTIAVMQSESFGNIDMESQDTGTPHYN